MFRKLLSRKKKSDQSLKSDCLLNGFLVEKGVLVLYLGDKSVEVVPSVVKEISDGAFSNRSKLISIMIPGNVSRIGKMAFSNCKKLSSVTISTGVKEIGKWAFFDCESLTSITIPESVNKIGEYAFCGCKNLSSITIPASIKVIEDCTFEDCANLSSVIIPDSVKEIGYAAFGNCTSLSVIKLPNSVGKIKADAFYGPLVTVVCQEGSYPHRFCQENGYRYIFDYQYEAFHGIVPSGIEVLPVPFPADEIKPYIFISYSHRDRDEVFHYIKALYESGWRIWYDEGLTIGEKYDMTLEDHVKRCDAFLLFVTKNSVNSNYIREFEIPWAKTYQKPIIKCTIDKEVAFEIEESLVFASTPPSGIGAVLEKISMLKKGKRRVANGISVAVNPTEREISNRRGFAYCIYSKQSSAMARAILRGCILYDAIKRGANQKRLQTCSCIIIFIDRAFLSDPELIEILMETYQAGKDIVLCCLEEINELCFPKELRVLTKLHWLTLNGNTTDINKMLAIHLQKRGCRDTTVLPEFNYEKTKNGIILTKYTGMAVNTYIEREYCGIPVIGIGEYTFMNCMYLKTVVIPDSVKQIGRCSFKGCQNLSAITIPYGITKIQDMTFSECTSLISVNIPDSVTEIDNMAFFKCSNLRTISLPKRLKRIGSGAFSGCKSLTAINLPSSLDSIDYAAFMDFTGLRSIIIPDGVKEIRDLAFCGCLNLISIVIPDSVLKIGESAFEDCENLTIFGNIKSSAHEYAQKYNYAFSQK